jgi:hypothetical protein
LLAAVIVYLMGIGKEIIDILFKGNPLSDCIGDIRANIRGIKRAWKQIKAMEARQRVINKRRIQHEN